MSRDLLLDAGNTRLKWRVVEQGILLAEGVTSYPVPQTTPWSACEPDRAFVCNVAGKAVAMQLQQALQMGEIEWLQSSADRAGVRNLYRVPEQLGADRFAALIGARARVGERAVIVVMAGTAMTVDALTAGGEFLGGVIVPGLQLMRSALQQGTANLGMPAGEVVLFPVSTGEAIVTGAHIALAGAIQVMHQRLLQRDGLSPGILLSGGDAEALLTWVPQAQHVQNLVLDGLARLAADANPTDKMVSHA
ncbi:type III pantothenate kinase [Burkholderiaceae bacterium DAT-1]|nr:type III pantothenate kinase [Burkholderiaceae bacterium DAT-1]